jgi:hypothetical protein
MRRATPANNNFQIYNSTEIAAHYAGLSQITPCEHLLFRNTSQMEQSYWI